jgi:hypothetical protein
VSISKLEYPNGYPDRLRANGRSLDNKFTSDERLFLRIHRISPNTEKPEFSDIRCPDLSVNRSKYSDPEDVLWSKFVYLVDWGIGSLTVGQATFGLPSGDGVVIDFKVEHDPVAASNEAPENFSHCEIRAYKLGQRRPKVSNALKSEFRQRIAEAVEVLQAPATF